MELTRKVKVTTLRLALIDFHVAMFQDDKCIQIVLGNESCDLDSAVGAISYAFLLQVVANHIGLLTKH